MTTTISFRFSTFLISSDLQRISLTVFISVAGAFIVGRYPTMSFVISSSSRAWMLKPVHPGIFWLMQSVFCESSQRKFFLSASLLWSFSSSVAPPVLSDCGPTLSPDIRVDRLKFLSDCSLFSLLNNWCCCSRKVWTIHLRLDHDTVYTMSRSFPC